MKMKGIGAIAALIAFFLLAGVALSQMDNPGSYRGCGRYDRAIAALMSEREAAMTDAARKSIDKSIGDVRKQLALDMSCQTGGPAPSPTASTSPTPSPSAAPAADTWTPHYYYFDTDKQGSWTFGPAVQPEVAEQEFRTRMQNDPVLLCGNGGVMLTDKDGGNDCVQSVLSSKSARDAYYDSVFSNVESITVGDGPEWATGAYMTDDGTTPYIIAADDIHYQMPYKVLAVKMKDGRTIMFRLACGFQWVKAANPSHSVAAPYHKAQPCVNGNNRDATTGSCGDTPITPVTPEPSTTPEPTPTPTPTPEACPPMKDGSTPPRLPDGTCLKDVAAGSGSNGNAGNGGDRNQDPSQGEATDPKQVLDTPREEPAAPTPNASPAPMISSSPDASPSVAVDPSTGTNDGVVDVP